MDASSVVMIIFTIILFIAVMGLSLMNIAQSLDPVNEKFSSAPVLKNMLEDSQRKTVKKGIAIGMSAAAIISIIILTITGASAKKEAFSYLLQ